jgi:ureidoacrylate peracid hydrolase
MQINRESAVIVIDMQNDFCSSDGALARRGADVARNQQVAKALPPFLDRARDAGALIIWIRQGARDEYVSDARRARALAMGRGVTEVAGAGTWGAELYDGLVPAEGDVTIEKTKYSAFVDTPLRNVLHSRNRNTIIVCGTAANVCVDSTVRDGYMSDLSVVVPSDMVGYTSKELADAALKNLDFYFCDVVDSDSMFTYGSVTADGSAS